MNFFDHQDAAKRATRRLVVMFTLIMVAVVAILYAPWAISRVHEAGPKANALAWWDPGAFLLIGGASVAVMLLGAGVKRLQLSGGGKSVAESLGGAWLNPTAASPAERRLLDVVEEMAIASGMPVPPVYVIEDASINAFAAGNTPKDAVLGFTRGAIDGLTRDELQGVVAHEFSHVAHGDMRLNLRLACAVAGVMVIALIGRGMLQVLGSASRRSSKRNDATAGLLLVALLLLVAGSLGAFFGRILQAAVSRQREFLADASAAQYTRHPASLASALRRIAGLGRANRLDSEAASGLNHFFFTSAASTWLATHPPIEERIRRLEAFGGTQGSGAPTEASPGSSVTASGAAAGLAAMRPTAAGLAPASTTDDTAAPAFLFEDRRAHGVATDGATLSNAVELLHRVLPQPVLQACREPFDAQAVLLLTTWSDDEAAQAVQRQAVRARLGAPALHTVQALRDAMRRMPDSLRLAVVDLCMPALQQLSRPQYEAFRDTLGECMRADRRVDLFEWTLRSVLARRVEGRFGALRDPVGSASLASMRDACRMLLSTLAWAGDAARAHAAFARGAEQVRLAGTPPLDRAACSLDALDTALERLAHLSRAERRHVVDAAAAVVCEDGTMHPRELMLLRGIGDRLDVLVPSTIEMMLEDATGAQLGG